MKELAQDEVLVVTPGEAQEVPEEHLDDQEAQKEAEKAIAEAVKDIDAKVTKMIEDEQEKEKASAEIPAGMAA